jgi:hypothetical protein
MRHWSLRSRDAKALGRRFAGRTAAAHFTRNGSDCCRNRRRPHALSASHVRSDLVRIRALYTPGAQASNHLIMEARSPFSARFQPIEISCPQISLQQTALLERGAHRPWRLTRSWMRSRHEPKAQSWPRSYIRLPRWQNPFLTAAKLLRGVGAEGLKV